MPNPFSTWNFICGYGQLTCPEGFTCQKVCVCMCVYVCVYVCVCVCARARANVLRRFEAAFIHLQLGENPSHGMVTLDDIYHALIVIFQIMTQEGWVDIMYPFQDRFFKLKP